MLPKIKELEIISLHRQDLKNKRNTAIIHRDFDNSYIVVRNVSIERNKIEWSHAIQYDIQSLTEATQVFIKAIN